MRKAVLVAVALRLLTIRTAFADDVPNLDGAVRDFRALVSELVAVDTTNPPGNEERAVAILAKRLDAEGIPYRISEFEPGRKNIVARLAGTGGAKPLLLLAHLDVVGADGQPWTSPPHEVSEKDGFLVGRGVEDDLGMAVLELETVSLLKRSGIPQRRDVILAFSGDEESGGRGIRWIIEHEPESIDAELAINEGGGMRLDSDGSKMSFVGLQAAEKTYQDFVLTAKGSTGHSSVPLGDNAINRLARALDRLARSPFPVRLLPVTREYFEARAAVEPPPLASALRAAASAKGAIPANALATLEANPVLAATIRTTCVATLVSGGTRKNALPASAEATINCRILPDETVEEVRRALGKKIDDPAITIALGEGFGSGPPSSLEGAGPAAVKKVAAEMWPRIPVIPLFSLGATDSRFLRAHGVAAYGLNPIALTESDARRAHGIDERIPVSSVRPGLEYLYRLVLELAR
jgi:acetylornithine deacetylase/succinyl-diaminopimelate desuccinylase-like protein